jgi:hypothetical protein
MYDWFVLFLIVLLAQVNLWLAILMAVSILVMRGLT